MSEQREVILAGRANAGKTSLMMALTKTHQRPINFPGTSVERVEGECHIGGADFRVVDLPGIASLVAASRDEKVALDYLQQPQSEKTRTVCVVLDASKLSVELRLLKQLTQLSLPMVVALNKADLAQREGATIQADVLASATGVPVYVINARNGEGIEDLAQALGQGAGTQATSFDPENLAATVVGDFSGRDRLTDRLDRTLLHPLWGPLCLVAIAFVAFQLVFTVAEPFVSAVESGQEALGSFVASLIAPGALRSLLIDGIINGVGAALVFVPQIALLIALVSMLEGSGYMARAVCLLDRFLGKVGLSGKSFVPLASSFACAIPGVLATRIIDNERDRLATIAVAPLMSCSARLPVYVVLIGAFFPAWAAGTVLFSMYLVGIVVAVVVAMVLRRTKLKGGLSVLALELPVYQWPAWRVVAQQVWNAVRQFLLLAGTVIFAGAIIVWALSYYPRPQAIHERIAQTATQQGLSGEEQAAIEDAAYLEQSYLARVGKTVQPVFSLAGFDWRITVGILAAFPARELIIPTLGTLYSLGEVDPGEFELGDVANPTDTVGLRDSLRGARNAQGQPVFNSLVALSLMVFFALCCQCVGTLGAIRRETHSWRWPVFVFTYMTTVAWLLAVAVYQIGLALGLGVQ